MNNLTILNQEIRTTDNGLFSLNDLHKASGGKTKHQPTNFMRLDTTQDLIKEINSENNRSSDMMNAFIIKQGGKLQGTFVCKELVYAYAMWISAKFSLLVIRTFDKLANQQPLKLESPYINDEQLRHIQEGVKKIVKETGKSFPTVYNTLFDFVKAPRLREIKKERYELACQFLGINPDFEVKADKVKRLTDKSYQSTIHGLAFMEYALHVKREQDKRIRKLQDALGEVYDLFEQVVRCNGAVFDGLYEPSNYLSTEKDQREQAKILGEKMFNSWKQQEKKFS